MYVNAHDHTPNVHVHVRGVITKMKRQGWRKVKKAIWNYIYNEIIRK